MKAPKYVIYTDHKANWNNKDEYIAVLSTNFLDAFDLASLMLQSDDTLYLVRLYEVVKCTKCREYKRVANVRPNFTLEHIEADTIVRHIENNVVWYERRKGV